MNILAIDLGKSKSVACRYDGDGHTHHFTTIRTTPREMHELILGHDPDRVVIEIGPTAGWVCDLCRAMEVPVQVANPNHEAWRWKSVKVKTDRDDALKLARLSVMDQLPTVHVPTPGVRAWRALISCRQALVKRRTAIRNTIRAILTRHGLDWPAGACGWSGASVRRLRERASDEGRGSWGLLVEVELDQLGSVGVAIERIERGLDACAERDERVSLLRTIPGVGPRLAETVVAVIDDPHRFKNGRQVGAYAGLAPRRFQSGSMDRQGRISGRGNALLRGLLVEVSWIGRQYNPWMKSVYERALRGSPSRRKIAIVALARRLLVVCWAMLRDMRPWKPPVSLQLAA